MPKHAFKFPPEVVAAVKQHVRKAIAAVNPARFHQEANYTSALVSQLQGEVYKGEHGSVTFESTVFDDRGPNSAESRFGADHAITAIISDGHTTIRKAILVQAKLGHIDTMSPSEKDSLKSQIRKMKQLVNAPKVMEISEAANARAPAMISGNQVLGDQPYKPMTLPEYFAARVTTTLDGCTDAEVVAAVQQSSLSRIAVTAKLIRKQ